MAEIVNALGRDEFATAVASMDEVTLTANIILQNGSLHAVRHLLDNGVTEEMVRQMESDLETSIGAMEQVAAERGYPIEFIRTFCGGRA